VEKAGFPVVFFLIHGKGEMKDSKKNRPVLDEIGD
jgi:hypothetical protein